mgnify:CR=1 FL=1
MKEGMFSTFYLSPKDYHRVHMPLDGKLREMIYLPGKLFSVNSTTSKRVKNATFKIIVEGEMPIKFLKSFASLDVIRDGNTLRMVKYEIIEK